MPLSVKIDVRGYFREHRVTESAGENVLETVSQQVSLRDPVSLVRIRVPVRGHKCDHLQCFDLETHWQVNSREHSSWACPVCGVAALAADLEKCDYSWNILSKVEHSVDTVTIFQDGKFEAITKNDHANRMKSGAFEVVDLT